MVNDQHLGPFFVTHTMSVMSSLLKLKGFKQEMVRLRFQHQSCEYAPFGDTACDVSR